MHHAAGMRGRVIRLATICAFASSLGCARGQTSALLDIDASPRVPLSALFGQVSVPSQPPGVEHRISSGPLTLPGTLVVLLPDVAEPATITLRAETPTGDALSGVVVVDAVLHAQVSQSVVLTPGGVIPAGSDLGDTASDLAGGGAADLGQPGNDMSTVVLAADTFHRPDQAEWGTASDGQVWRSDANTSAAFSIAGNAGVIAPATTGFQTAALGPSVADADLVVTGSMSAFVNGGTVGNNELAAMLRWVDNNQFYKAGMDGSIFRLYVRTSATTSTTLVKMNYPATAGTSYSIRFRAVGTTFMGKVWPSASAEPAGWMLTATDNSIAVGVCGMRMVFNGLATATFTSFLATAP
jgi:hypothetical protein